MNFDCTRMNGLLVVKPLAERLDAACADAFRGALLEEAAAQDGTVLLDLSEVTFVDSRGLGALVGTLKAFTREGRRLILCGLRPGVCRTFRLTRMDRVFKVHASPEEACAATGVA